MAARTLADLSREELEDMLRRVMDVRHKLSNWGDKMPHDEIESELNAALRARRLDDDI